MFRRVGVVMKHKRWYVNKVPVQIGIATDHRGFIFKEAFRVQAMIGEIPVIWHDFGCFSPERTDYPPYAHAVADAITQHRIDRGVLLCGSGAGMAITANRHPKIYAAVAWNKDSARNARADDNSNVLVIPVDYVTQEQAQQILYIWLTTPFKEGRYAQRLHAIDNMNADI